MSISQPPEPRRSQSTTSLSRLYQGSSSSGPNGGAAFTEAELSDPKMDFCNAFWGTGDRGFDVVMTRLRGAGRTVEELRSYWKERAAIEEDYAKRLTKLSRTTLGKDEVGDLADALQHLLAETAQQANYHSSLGNEIRQTVEQPTTELGSRLHNLKKGLQASVEKAYKNKGLQEQHVQKARERYEQDCLKLNSYTAQSSLTQGKELDKIQSKLERVRQTIGANEQDFRQFVRVLEQTQAKWEGEWKGFCDHVQDLEEDRLALTKDLVWTYANAVSQVCVEDDSSCERIREKLEQFEPQNDMLNFVKGWGTGDMIPDPPRFINYNLGESYPTQPAFHEARFQRISSRPPMPPSQAGQPQLEQEPESEEPAQNEHESSSQPNGAASGINGLSDNLHRTTLQDEPPASDRTAPAPEADRKPPFGGVALPGMASATSPPPQEESKFNSMPPPPVPPTMSMPEPRIPSRQSNHSPAPRNVNDEEDPMAKALADLRREPPPPGSVRRNASHRRAESVVSASGSTRGSQYGHGIKSPSSPAPNRMSYHQQQQQQHQHQPNMPPAQSRGSVDMTLSPPQSGHTAAALAKSMEEFRQQSSRGPDPKRQSVNYANYADDIVGSHPTSRPGTPSGQAAPRAPSPAMMQPPKQPETHIADEVLSQYHQAFPGERSERSRSRAGSVISSHSRAGSFVEQQQQQQPASPSAQPREGFVGIGAGGGGGRSPSPQPPMFRSPSPSPVMNQGSLGPQNLGIALDAKGGVAQDTMAEQYRRQYQQQQQQQQGPPPQAMSSYPGQRNSQYGAPQQQMAGSQDQRSSMYGAPPKSPMATSPGGMPPSVNSNRPRSGGFESYEYNAEGRRAHQQSVPSNYVEPTRQSQQHPAWSQTGNYEVPPFVEYSRQFPPAEDDEEDDEVVVFCDMRAPRNPRHGPLLITIHPNIPTAQPPPQPSYGQYPGPSSLQLATTTHNQPPQPAYGQHPSPSQPYGGINGYGQNAQPPQGYVAPPQQQQHQQQPYQTSQYARAASPAPQQQQQQQYGYRAPSPQPQQQQQQQYGGRAGQTPSPQPNQPPPNVAPTGQWAANGLPVLFYVKALYDYAAQSAAEFDFQAGDIIAVTSTPEDGWWSGELLDEARRIPGRTDFPSNL
ncbi:hypothetical protein IAT40_007195 [Kwoniella sp. CBS 6097]